MQRRDTGIAGLLGQLREPETPEVTARVEPPVTKRTPPSDAVKSSSRGREVAPPVQGESGKAARRSKVGKRSNPDYGLRGLWLRTDTYLDVTDRLRRRREYADASELVQTLLERWLRSG